MSCCYDLVIVDKLSSSFEESLNGKGPSVARAGRFEDLLVWQKARILTKQIYIETRSKSFGLDRSLSSQLQRCAVSIMANIAEGFARRGSGEFAHFLSIALGSCAELKSHLYVALDCEYLVETKMKALFDQSDEVSRMLSSLERAVKASKHKPRP